ncbi:MAG: sulfur oxidation c-type cytochrome SoxX [Hyphomicrobiales bacterium]|nr:sulfur oxidation c-type cytochrome SoxX [Hyphomicrobiales bacterium]
MAAAILVAASLAASPRAQGLVAFNVEGDAITRPLGDLDGDASRGLAIVRDRRVGNCLICHAAPIAEEPFQGEIGPRLHGIGARLSAGQIRLRLIDQSILNAETLMPPYYRVSELTDVAPEYAGRPGLSAQQIEDVVAYLSGLRE